MKARPNPAENAWSRREFLRVAAMSSAMLLGSRSLFAEADTETENVAWYGPLRALAPGAVKPNGWLRVWLQKQAAQLGSHLPEVSWPFTEDYWGDQQQGAYWTQEQEYEAWWPWEQRAYWIDGATRLGILLDDEQLLAKTTRPIFYTLTHPDKENYLGPELFQDPLGDYHRWPHTVFFRGVSAASDGQVALPGLTRQQIAQVIQRHYLSDTASYGKPKRNVNNIEDMLWVYQQTREPAMRALAENAWQEYCMYPDDPENADLGAMRVFADTPVDAHGETYAETSKQPAILYLYTGNHSYLNFGLMSQRRIFDHHMLVDGVPSTSEWFAARTALDSHETCDITDHTWSWGYYLMATGDASWADRVERAVFNAAPGAIRKDWKALQYFSCPNQVLATLNSDHNWPKFKEHGGSMMAFQPNPGQRTACCGGNVHRVFPNYVIRMWMQSREGGLAAVLYGPSTVRAQVGASHEQVEIVQTTRYPFEELIRFRFNTSSPVAFPLALRIPGWCAAPSLALNGKRVPARSNAQGFVVLDRTFRQGDELTLTLPMQTAVSRWPQSGIAVERGPLVYSLPVEPKWTSTVVPRYSTEEFPAWEATPQTAWNYALALDETTLATDAVFQQQPVATDADAKLALTGESEADFDPWVHPPVNLTVPARKIEGWTMQVNPDDPAQKFTPPLPDTNATPPTGPMERIQLAPYGSTHLRVTVFPQAPREKT